MKQNYNFWHIGIFIVTLQIHSNKRYNIYNYETYFIGISRRPW